MSIANPYLHGSNPAEAHSMRLRRAAAVASLTVAVVLIAAKFAAYLLTNSVSIMTSLMDSTFDALASGVTLVSIIHAATPADEDHRFGHGKLEALAAMGQALFIFGSAGYLFIEAVHRVMHPEAVRAVPLGIGVMLLSIVLTVGLVSFQRHVIRRTKSVAISADHLHYKGDLLFNLGVLASLGASYYTNWPYLDPLFAGGIALSLLFGAGKISRESFGILMDQELPGEDRARIEELVRGHPAVRAIHDLRTRHSGHQIFIEFHLEMDGDLTLKAAHDVTEEIELMIYRAFPKSEVLIHQEPTGLDNHHRLDDKLKGQSA